MFVVHGTFPVKPSVVEELKRAVDALTAATRAEEGNLSYEWAESIESPGTFYSIEKWVSRAALDAHFQTEHVRTATAELPNWLAGQPSLVGYETDEEVTLPL